MSSQAVSRTDGRKTDAFIHNIRSYGKLGNKTLFRVMLVIPSRTRPLLATKRSALLLARRLQHGSDILTCELCLFTSQDKDSRFTNKICFREACCVHQGALFEPGSDIENPLDGCAKEKQISVKKQQPIDHDF